MSEICLLCDMKKEKRQTFTYYGSPSIRKKAMKRAEKVGSSLGEVIDLYLEQYAQLPVYKVVTTGLPAKDKDILTSI